MPGGRKAAPLSDPEEIALWEQLLHNQGKVFLTSGRGSLSGVPFSYEISGAEIFVSVKAKSITRASVIAAYKKAKELDGVVPGPKTLGVFGASYLYPVFLFLGVIKKNSSQENDASVSDRNQIDTRVSNNYNTDMKNPNNPTNKEMDDMPRPKGSKNKKAVVIVENVEEKMAVLETEIEKLTAELKNKKAELKSLAKAKVEADKAAALKKAEEDKQKLLTAVEKSGKSIEEILELLK